MAGRLSLPEVDLSCPICCEIFTDPVVLKCSHSFCAPCLQKYWSQRGRNRDCPLCRTKSVDDPVPSLTLKNLCESVVLESEGPEAKQEELYCDPGEMCPLHGEKLKLYCLQDKEPICVVCHTSRKHKQHDCCPVNEAIVDIKVIHLQNKSVHWTVVTSILFVFNSPFKLFLAAQEKMKSALTSLQKKKNTFDKIKKNYEDTVVHIQVQCNFR